MEGCTSTHTCVIRAAERGSSCVCELGGVNPLLINGCACCAEDTNGSVIHACMHAPHPCLCLARSLSFDIFLPLSPPAHSLKWHEEQGVCGSSKVRLRFRMKRVLLLLGHYLQAAGCRQPLLMFLG